MDILLLLPLSLKPLNNMLASSFVISFPPSKAISTHCFSLPFGNPSLTTKPMSLMRLHNRHFLLTHSCNDNADGCFTNPETPQTTHYSASPIQSAVINTVTIIITIIITTSTITTSPAEYGSITMSFETLVTLCGSTSEVHPMSPMIQDVHSRDK